MALNSVYSSMFCSVISRSPWNLLSGHIPRSESLNEHRHNASGPIYIIKMDRALQHFQAMRKAITQQNAAPNAGAVDISDCSHDNGGCELTISKMHWAKLLSVVPGWMGSGLSSVMHFKQGEGGIQMITFEQ